MNFDENVQPQELSLEECEDVSGGAFGIFWTAVALWGVFAAGSAAGFGVAVAQDQATKANERNKPQHRF